MRAYQLNLDLFRGYIKHPETTIDLVLIKVKDGPIRKDEIDKYRINHICLPVPNIINNKPEDALFCGFGDINEEGRKQSFTLRKTKYVIETPQYCKRFHNGLQNLTEDKICAVVDKNIMCYVSNQTITQKSD